MSRRVMNLAHMLTQNARRHGDRAGFIWGDKSWTWREIDGHVSALAAGLAARGVVKGDRILVHSKNCDEMFWSMFAAFRLGAVWVPTNFRLMPDEVAYLATASGAKAFLCHGDFPDHAKAAANPALEFIWRIGEGTFGEKSVGGVIADHAGARVDNAAVDYDDPCWFFFTSGTTGRSKAAVLTHGQMAFVVTNHLADLMPGTTETDASLVVAPLSHGAGVHQLVQAARGVPTILLPSEKFDIAEAFRLIEAHRVSNIFTVPTILKMMVEHPAVDKYDHSSLRFVIYAGAPMYREDQKAALNKLGPVLVQYFGLGEVTGNITVMPANLHDPEDGPQARIGTCGFERTGMQVSIQGDDGRELKAVRDRRDLRDRSRRVRRLLRQPRGQREGVSRRLVSYRRSRPHGRGGIRLHHRPRLGHVHLGRLQHLSARGRGEDSHAPGDRRGRRPRRARPVLGRGWRSRLRRARGCGRGERGGAGRVPGAEGAALQNAEALLLLGGAAEIRLRQDSEAAGPR